MQLLPSTLNHGNSELLFQVSETLNTALGIINFLINT